jgi:ubiquinone/menaquinone biosynthesis C-methylase UbiE
MTSPDFSPVAKQYARSRPQYPDQLFQYLASLTGQHYLAWDCATGNGQAALGLVKHFDRVIATDVSAEQIRQAAYHPQIEYRVGAAERSGIGDRSVDLVTVASAIHWFELGAFSEEIRRVVQPGGVLAAWTYHVGHVQPPFDKIFRHFYDDILYPYFAPGARLVDQRYETLALPGKALPARAWSTSAAWNFDQMVAFINSWSGTQQFIKEQGKNPVALIAEELERIWGEPASVHVVRWPLYMRISRL